MKNSFPFRYIHSNICKWNLNLKKKQKRKNNANTHAQLDLEALMSILFHKTITDFAFCISTYKLTKKNKNIYYFEEINITDLRMYNTMIIIITKIVYRIYVCVCVLYRRLKSPGNMAGFPLNEF